MNIQRQPENVQATEIAGSYCLVCDTVRFQTKRSESFDWHFKVQRMDPLLPEHELIKQRCREIACCAEDQGVLAELYMFLEWLPNDCFETLKKDPMIVLRLSKIDNDCFETLATILNDCFETVKDLVE